MTATGKFRNEDLSVYFFIKGIDIGGGKTLGDIATIVDGYPYNEIEQSTLVLPTISVEVRLTTDEEAGELGASWFRRSWAGMCLLIMILKGTTSQTRYSKQ